MERQKKVIDANMGVKWFSQEENFEKARALLNLHITGEILLVVPELFFYEVINALKYKKTTEESIKKAIEELFNFQLEKIDLSEKISMMALEISLKYKLSIYDALYLALAELLDIHLITADKKILATKHPLVGSLK